MMENNESTLNTSLELWMTQGLNEKRSMQTQQKYIYYFHKSVNSTGMNIHDLLDQNVNQYI